MKDVASDTPTLANARAPKYAASILFLEVIAYILKGDRIIRSMDVDGLDVPQRDEDVRRKQEKHNHEYLYIVRGKAAG